MENYVGEIRLFAGSYAPEGWVLCNGQTLDVNSYQPLFALIGTTYGGDGVKNFAVPDLRGRVPVCQNNPAVTGVSNFVVGQKGGAETVTLTTAQIPGHTHSLAANAAVGTTNTPGTNTVLAGVASPVQVYNPAGTAVSNYALNQAAIRPSGSSQGHNNIMPSIVLSYIMATTGIFPTAN
jgi:microcystin-dependent protein